MCQLEPTNVVLAHSPHCTHMCTFLQDLLRSQASVAPPSSRGSSLLEILLWIDVSSQINSQTKTCSVFMRYTPLPLCPRCANTCEYVGSMCAGVAGRAACPYGTYSHVFSHVFHVFGVTYFAILIHVFPGCLLSRQGGLIRTF